MEWYGRANILQGGLAFTDMATTVSPSHAFEVRTEAGGFGLHDTFLGLRDRLVGILNGIDFGIWDPAGDPAIRANYTPEDLSGKKECKLALQEEYELPRDPGIRANYTPEDLSGKKECKRARAIRRGSWTSS